MGIFRDNDTFITIYNVMFRSDSIFIFKYNIYNLIGDNIMKTNILRNYFAKQFNREIKLQLKRDSKGYEVVDKSMIDIINYNELKRIHLMLMSVYDLSQNDVDLIQWGLLGMIIKNEKLSEWINNGFPKSDFKDKLDVVNLNRLKFAYNKKSLE